MFKIKTYNNIAPIGISQFSGDRYQVSGGLNDPDALLLRSYSLHGESIPSTVKAIARAGAGVNNIPVEEMSKLGIPVFNTPGANANAVKELVIASIFLASRHLFQAHDFLKQLDKDTTDLSQQIEKLKKQFVGQEVPGKTIAVIGLGAIGVLVANTAENLGMKVIGYDPGLTIENAWKLSSSIERATDIKLAITHADFISLHVPLNEHTQGLFNQDLFKLIKKDAVLLNFSRDSIVEEKALFTALEMKQLKNYVTDFPTASLLKQDNVICLPHLGASTLEAEDNCAVQAARELIQFLETGQIECSVNFPEVKLPLNKQYTRLTVTHENIPNMVGQISTLLATQQINITDMVNHSRKNIAYTLIDLEKTVSPDLLYRLREVDGVIRTVIIG